MTDPTAVANAYRRALGNGGETVTVRRGPSGAPVCQATVLARLMGYQPTELSDLVEVGDRKALLLAADLVAGGYMLPLQPGDVIRRASGETFTIRNPDDVTVSIGDTVVGYWVHAKGVSKQ